MLGLFEITWDYYCWEDLICVSDSRYMLRDEYKKIDQNDPLLSEDDSHIIYREHTEIAHYVIKKVKLLEVVDELDTICLQ